VGVEGEGGDVCGYGGWESRGGEGGGFGGGVGEGREAGKEQAVKGCTDLSTYRQRTPREDKMT